jgi:hypothetical protein
MMPLKEMNDIEFMTFIKLGGHELSHFFPSMSEQEIFDCFSDHISDL